MDAFCILKNSLVSEPVMAFPRVDHQYTLITDVATGTANTAGGHGTIQTQKDEFDNFYAISSLHMNSRKTRKTRKSIPTFIWNRQLLYGVWMCSVNTLKESNPSSSQITKLWKRCVTFITEP
jgi:hypothetical protein